MAEKLPMLVTGFVVTIGGPVAVSVVNIPSLPKAVPPPLWATILK